MSYITRDIELPIYLQKIGCKTWIGEAEKNQLQLMKHVTFLICRKGKNPEKVLSFSMPINTQVEDKFSKSCTRVANREFKKKENSVF